MPIYVTIGGTQRELSSIPAMVNGAQRELKSFLATVDGVQRELLAAKTRWERYKVNVKSSYEMVTSSTYSVTASESNDESIRVYSDCTLSQSTGEFTLSGTKYTAWTWGSKSSNQEEIDYVLDNGLLWFDGETYRSGGAAATSGPHTQVGKIKSGSAASTRITWNCDVYTAKLVETQTRGAYIDEVESTDENAYPADGVQDGYWYVKI